MASLLGLSPSSEAHEIGVDVSSLPDAVRDIESALDVYARRSPLPAPPSGAAAQRRALGEAEVEHALGHEARALGILLARLDDPEFRSLPEHADALILVSLVLERMGEVEGAMSYARTALEVAARPRQLTEAVGRWFRLARVTGQLEDRLAVFELWRSRGGLDGAPTEVAARVAYEVGFALRSMGRRIEARQMLSRVPSDSEFGSRAAYVTAALFVEDGDLGNAERWFSAVMDWPLPDFEPEHPQMAIEAELRALAALSAARLHYDRGALPEARAAYERIPVDSRHRRDACWELAFLDNERGLRRAALVDVACVKALGTPAGLRVDLQLLESSLLAHTDRYTASVEAYQATYDDVLARRDLVARSFANIQRPAEFLFAGMERTSVEQGREATPGPATLFEGAWTQDMDQAYRIDRGAIRVVEQAELLLAEVEAVAAILATKDGFEPLELRQKSLERLLREIDHLSSHAGDLAYGPDHASAVPAGHVHPGEAEARRELQRLPQLRKRAEAQLAALAEEGRQRTATAKAALVGLRADLGAVRSEALALRQSAVGPFDAVARAALDAVIGRLDDAAMRAESGVLDTYWIRKQRRTREVERLLDEQKSTEGQLERVVRSFE